MRYGMSWPAGHGRREWVSMGPVGWVVLICLALPLYLIGWAVIGVIFLLCVLADGVVWLARISQRRDGA